jgi:hypothetical protein
MRLVQLLVVTALAVVASGCNDDTVAPPTDLTPPAAPRGVFTVTGDHQATLYWLANTEGDVAGYRIYTAPVENGPDGPYFRAGTVAAPTTSFVVTGLANGVTKYLAVTAVDNNGNESELSYDTVFDTPRPAGFGATLANFVDGVAGAGWDFSASMTRASDDPATDIFFGYNGAIYQMFTRDNMTDIQDMGWAGHLDAIDWAPEAGWSPSGTVELIPGHCYVVWTRDNHFAKFRVTGLSSSVVVFDWAYQTDPGNPELRAGRAIGDGPVTRPIAWLR